MYVSGLFILKIFRTRWYLVKKIESLYLDHLKNYQYLKRKKFLDSKIHSVLFIIYHTSYNTLNSVW